jgi:alpha-amylase
MKNIRIFCAVLLTLLSNASAFAQADTSVMLQGFNWLSHNNNWYPTVGAKIADIKASRIDAIWLPPPSDAASNEGYLPRELYKLNSQYGTQVQLQTLINSLHTTNIKALADIVINHRVGLLDWGDFTNPTWGCWAATSDDEWTGACGNPDTGLPYGAARDLDHTNATVRADLKTWMNWLKNTIGFDGWRYDFVHGYSAGYIKEYNDATSPYFSVGENWDGDKNVINNWIIGAQGSSAAFDFALKGVLHTAVNGNYSVLSESGNAPGVIGMNPSKAVTFIDNHDTGSPQALWPFPSNKVMQGYAYILTHPGIPMVFWDHIYNWGLHDEITNIIKVRKNNGLNSTSTIVVQQAQTNLYAAIIDDKVAMKIGPGSWNPGSGYTLRASGIDYAVWDKKGTSECLGPIIVNTTTVPTIDGTIDPAWTNAPTNAITYAANGSLQADFTGTKWRALYDNTNLYILIEVKDASLSQDGPNPWDDDAVEIFIDGNNDKAATYDANDFQYGFRWNIAANTTNMYGVGARTGITYAIPTVTGGYNLEVAIPWSTIGVTPVNGKLIGFEININDDDNGGAREATGSWYSAASNAYNNPGVFGAVALTVCTTSALPVTYLSLAAARGKEEEVNVKWKVAGEIAMQQYDVERSADGIHFITIHTITSLGNNSYSVADNHAPTGFAYYRIKGLSSDGEMEYSSMKYIAAVKGFSEMVLYPNPVNMQGSLSVHIVNQQQGKFQLRLYNYLGQVVLQNCLEVVSDNSFHSLNLSPQISPGYYQIEIVDEAGNRTMQKLVVQ